MNFDNPDFKDTSALYLRTWVVIVSDRQIASCELLPSRVMLRNKWGSSKLFGTMSCWLISSDKCLGRCDRIHISMIRLSWIISRVLVKHRPGSVAILEQGVSVLTVFGSLNE